MIAQLLETVRHGAVEFEVIASALGSREAADCAILGALAKKLIIRENAKYRMPHPPKKDPPMPPEPPTRIKGQCYCGNPIYRRGAKFCSHRCHANTQFKQRPGCVGCGHPVVRGQSKYCSTFCRHKHDGRR
jgi:hypothetical protein